MKKLTKIALLLASTAFVFQTVQAATVKFRFPIANADRSKIAGLPIVGKDHDGSGAGNKLECKNHSGATAPFCYNGHGGTDFMLIGGFLTMDRGSAEIVAAADGVVEKVVDGNFDRCSAINSGLEVSCYGHKKAANYVTILHNDGTKTRYYHMMKNSIRVREGQRVRCGQALGLVGSSGNSSMPHLHFDVINEEGKTVDPYAGKLSQRYSYWRNAYEADGLPSSSCKTNQLPGRTVQCAWETVQCAWETVQDAVTCGTENVTNAVACGVQTVTSAAQCGVDTVTSAAQCGVRTITSAAQCGTKVITSAAQCGVNFITNVAQCVAQGLNIFNGGCNVPKSCSVAKTCNIPKTCDVPKSCSAPKTCSIPRSCQVKKCGRQMEIRQFPELDFER